MRVITFKTSAFVLERQEVEKPLRPQSAADDGTNAYTGAERSHLIPGLSRPAEMTSRKRSGCGQAAYSIEKAGISSSAGSERLDGGRRWQMEKV